MRDIGTTGSWAFNHSLAEAIAFEIISSGVADFLLKRRLFLPIQRVHKSHGINTSAGRPIGGRQFKLIRHAQFTGKSINPLPSTFGWIGVNVHTLWANSHWKNRWWIDSVRPHLIHLWSPAMFLDISLSPTGKAPWKVFQRKSLIFGATFSFQTPLFQSNSAGGVVFIVPSHHLIGSPVTRLCSIVTWVGFQPAKFIWSLCFA